MVRTPFEAITAETLEAIQKAQTNGVLSTTGVFGYDLSGVVSLVPVVTPWYERVARKQAPEGSDSAVWRALLNVNNQQPNPFVGRDAAGNFVVVSEQDVSAKYQPVRVSGEVTQDAMDFARNYADAKAIASIQTLMQWRIQDDRALIGGQNFALPTIGALTLTTATTGGTIASGTTLYVKAAARSPYNFYWGGSGIASAAANTTVGTTTSTNTVTATLAAVRGAVAYDWWTSTDGTTYYYTTTTTVNTATFTATLSAANTVPSIPDLYGTAPSDTPPTSDTSYSANSYNGLLATLAGSYSSTGPLVTYGTSLSTASGATFTSLDGATLTGTAQGITELDALNSSIYSTAQVSPTAYLCAPQQASDMASKVLATNAAVTYLQPESGRVGITGGASLGRYINRVTGDTIEIVPDPHMPQGTIVAITERVPYPNSNIAATFECRTLREVSQFDYGPSLTAGGAGSGPRYLWDQSSIESFINRAPVTCGVLSNVAAG